MKSILLISATSAEIAPLLSFIEDNWHKESEDRYHNNAIHLNILITGVGMVSTTYSLTKILQHQSFDLVIQAGIAGSYDRNIALGDVVQVKDEVFGDLGAEDHYNFLDLYDLGFAEGEKKLTNPFNKFIDDIGVPKVSSLTVNTTTGSDFTAIARGKKFGYQIESMEGGAFHYVCLKENVAFAQIRAISNYIEARDRSAWRIEEAVKNLNEFIRQFLIAFS